MVRIRGGPASEAISGGPGRDRLAGGAGADSLAGADGRDRLSGGAGRDRLEGGEGGDRLEGGAGGDRLLGGAGHDTLDGGRGRGDALLGGAGDDLLRVEGPGALVMPGDGADTVEGRGDTSLSYADLGTAVRVDLRAGRATGDEVDDRLSGISLALGSGFDDVLRGGARRQWEGFAGGPGDDRIDGRAGYDEVLYALDGAPAGVDVDLAAGLARDGFGGTDRLKRIEAVTGTLHDDVLRGGASPFESFAGLAGNDVIRGRGGADRADYSRDAREGGEGGVRVNLVAGRARDGFGDRDRLVSVESVVGTASADRLRGDARDNRLEGGAGRDTLLGGAGRDRIEGGPGRDRLAGGEGEDRFDWRPGDGRDRIAGFTPGEDRLRLHDLDATGFHELTLRDGPRGAVLRFGGGDAIRFRGLDAEDLGPGDVWLI